MLRLLLLGRGRLLEEVGEWVLKWVDRLNQAVLLGAALPRFGGAGLLQKRVIAGIWQLLLELHLASVVHQFDRRKLRDFVLLAAKLGCVLLDVYPRYLREVGLAGRGHVRTLKGLRVYRHFCVLNDIWLQLGGHLVLQA